VWGFKLIGLEKTLKFAGQRPNSGKGLVDTGHSVFLHRSN
jgi:hypothetical protein